jgi:hypothetical protein
MLQVTDLRRRRAGNPVIRSAIKARHLGLGCCAIEFPDFGRFERDIAMKLARFAAHYARSTGRVPENERQRYFSNGAPSSGRPIRGQKVKRNAYKKQPASGQIGRDCTLELGTGLAASGLLVRREFCH